MSLRNYLKGIADALRSNGANNEPINAQDFSYKIYEIAEHKYSAGMAEGYNTGQEVGYENGHEEGYNKGYIDASPQETVSGEAICITDALPIEHNMGVSVRRKNLLSPSSTKNTATPFTFDASAKDGTIIINGTGDNTSYSIMSLKSGASFNNMLIDGETYTIAMDVSVQKKINLLVRATKLSNNSDVYYQVNNFNNYCTTFKVDKSTYKYQELYLQINPTSEIYENVVVKPILAIGSYTSLPFVPYIEDISTVKLYKGGKNLIPFPYSSKSGNYKGVDVVVNDDGTMVLNGTATATDYFNFCIKDFGDVAIPGNSSKNGYALSAPSELHYNSNNKVLSLTILKGTTFNNYIVKPQLEIGTTSTEYEPYIKPTIYDVNADGIVKGVKSLYPSTTLYTNTSGAVIDCTYYQDGKKVKENLTNKFASTESVTEEVTE